MTSLTQEGALLADTYGIRLLVYLCATDEETVTRNLEGQDALNQAQQEALRELLAFATQIATTATQDNVPVAMHLDLLGRFNEDADTSIGNMLRQQAGGTIHVVVPDDPVAAPLTLLLRDVFPLMLIPPDRTLFPHPHLGRSVWNNPHREPFERAVLADPALSQLFSGTTEHGGWAGDVYTSTGAGGGIQLWTLPHMLLTNAWWRGRLNGDDSLEALAVALIELVDLLRRAISGEACTVKALQAFTGVVLEEFDEITLPVGVLRPIRDHERELAPADLEGRYTHSTADGDRITAAYAGDVVLEITIDYRLKIQPPDAGPLAMWPSDLREERERLEGDMDSIRFASLLTGKVERPTSFTPTWRMILDPLSWGPSLSWSDPRNRPSSPPSRMSPATAAELAGWVNDVQTQRQQSPAKRRQSLDIAIRRTVSAFADRANPADVLVDLVIVWEALFGSRRGESTLRVSAALAWLLEPGEANLEGRDRIQSQAAHLYNLRSDIVHGTFVTPEQAAKELAAARTLTLAALRRLFRERTDVLKQRDGSERSRTLILGG